MKYPKTSKGLTVLYWAMLVSMVLSLIVQVVDLLFGLPLDALNEGLNTATVVVVFCGVCFVSRECEKGKRAFVLALASALLSVLAFILRVVFLEIVPETIPNGIGLVSGILRLILLRVVLKAIGRMCIDAGYSEIDDCGGSVWRFKWATILVPLGLRVLTFILNYYILEAFSILVLVSLITLGVYILLEIVYLVKYLDFMGRARNVLSKVA